MLLWRLFSILTSPRLHGSALEYLDVQTDPGWLTSSGRPNISLQFLANSFSVSQVWPKSCERSNLIAAGRGEQNNITTWLMQKRVSKSRRISSCSPLAAVEPHQVSGWVNGSSAMRAGGWSSARQRGWVGRQEELLVQQLVSVNRVLPLAKLPIGGLQARPTHLDSVEKWKNADELKQTILSCWWNEMNRCERWTPVNMAVRFWHVTAQCLTTWAFNEAHSRAFTEPEAVAFLLQRS